MRLTLILSLFLFGCFSAIEVEPTQESDVYIKVLGVTQDAGFPQIGCEKDCCRPMWKPATPDQYVVSLGLIDKKNGNKWLVEATPDIKYQLALLNEDIPTKDMLPNGIFLTHAHIGHYSGLIQLGREAIGANNVLVHCMPRMANFLENNGPWSQLVKLENIKLNTLAADEWTIMTPELRIKAMLVPHRDEFSETVGFQFKGPNHSVFFVPDIDKWEKWDVDLVELLHDNELILIDGTFLDDSELPGRDMSEIPHPFIQETMALLIDLPDEQKSKVHFIHFNHTNPLLRDPKALQIIREAGFNVAFQGQAIPL